MKDDDVIPSCGEYRGVPLHSGQSEARLVAVRAAIDMVHATDNLHHLYDICCGAAVAPEARIFAAGDFASES